MLSMKTVALSVFVWLAVGSFAFADVQLSFRDGRVSIVAKDATVGQILTEWAKVGQTKIVNVERMPRAPLTIELENVSEERALDVVFRELSGYMAAPRPIAVPNASRFDRIIVVPASIVRTASAAPPGAKVSAASAYQAPESSQQESAYQAPASPQQESAYRAPASRQQPSSAQGATASPQQPSAYQAPGYPQQQSAYVPPPPADDTANDVNDVNDEPTIVGGAIPTLDPRAAAPNTAREALETLDPRKLRLEMLQPQGGVAIVPPTGRVLPGGGVAVPGMIAQPIPQKR